ncbi:MAG: helix-turn-helix transcriptional regulator [Alphaproteobacteria bacterium]|nr:helix-turn-helix transcriptional regulator [Alphaproteobacteria bacterium]
MGVKDRRKALGWDRAELARRAGVDRSALQLIERGEWSEEDALRRVDEVLDRTEAGEADVVLPPPRVDPNGMRRPD